MDPRQHILSVSDITCNSSTEVLYLLLLYFRSCLSLWWCSYHALVSTGNTWCYLFRGIDPITNHTISRLFVIKFYSSFLFSNCLQWGWYWWKYFKSLLSDPLFISRLNHDVSLCICGWIHLHLHSELYSLECVEDISAVGFIIYLQVRTDIHWNVLKMIYTILLGVFSRSQFHFWTVQITAALKSCTSCCCTSHLASHYDGAADF